MTREEGLKSKEDLERVSRLRRSRDVAGLAKFAQDESVFDLWRTKAIAALGKTGDERAIDPLVEIAENASTSRHRTIAVVALARLRHPGAVPHLLRYVGDPDEVVASWAADGLGHVGGLEVVPALAAVLDSDEWVVRRRAAKALGRIGGPDAALALTTAARRERRPVRKLVILRARRARAK